MQLEDINSSLQQTGCWWSNPWWENDFWYGESKADKALLLDAIELLKCVLTPQWVRSLGDKPLDHPFLRAVYFGEGLWQLGYFLGLASQLKYIQCLDGHEAVLRDFKSLPTAESAELEIFVAHTFGKTGADVKFIRAKPKRGKTPDFSVVTSGKEFVVECKRLRDSVAEKWVERYSERYCHHILNARPPGYELLHTLKYPEVDPDDYGHPCHLSHELAAKIDTLLIVENLARFFGNDSEPRYFDFGHRGEVWVVRSGEGIVSQVESPRMSKAFIRYRLVQNALMRASRQIQEYGKPGIAAVFYSRPPELAELKLQLPILFQAHQQEYRLLMGVLIFPAQNILTYVPPYWVSNPHADFDSKDYGLPQSLSKILAPNEVSPITVSG